MRTAPAANNIPMVECQKGSIYRLMSRNIVVGVYDGHGGFIGIRSKFGSEYLFTEYHWDQGPPFGTVHPKEVIGVLPEEILFLETIGTICERTGRAVVWRTEPQFHIKKEHWTTPGSWCYEGSDEIAQDAHVQTVKNQALFDYLASLTATEYNRRMEERGDDFTHCCVCHKGVAIKDTRRCEGAHWYSTKRVCNECPDPVA